MKAVEVPTVICQSESRRISLGAATETRSGEWRPSVMIGTKMMNDDELMGSDPDGERASKAYQLLSIDASQGLAELKALANRGSAMGMLYLGYAYGEKLGANIDYAEAVRWYKSAYDKGSFTALISLGMIYFDKIIDHRESERLFFEGASNGDGQSMYWLGRIYLLDASNKTKLDRVRTLWEDAAARGQVLAKYGLGLLFVKGRYGLKNIPKGFWLCATALANSFKISLCDATDRRLR